MHSFCTHQLRAARSDALSMGIDVPQFNGTTELSPDLYAVFLGDENYECDSCCKYGARALAIYEYIDCQVEKKLKSREMLDPDEVAGA